MNRKILDYADNINVSRRNQEEIERFLIIEEEDIGLQITEDKI